MKKEWTFRPDQMAESLSEADAFVENTTMERRYRIKLSLLIEELLLREQVAERYTKQLSDVIEVPLILKGYTSCWAQYTLKAKDNKERERILLLLKQNGIPTAVFYPTPIHMSGAYKGHPFRAHSLATTEELSSRVFSLPMHPYLSETEIDRICSIIRKK